MHIRIVGCRHFKMPGSHFAGEQRSFIALMYHCTLKFPTNQQQICSSFFWTQPTSQKHLQIPTYKTHYNSLNSQYVSKLCSYLFMPGRKKSFANKRKEEEACLQGCWRFIWLFIEENYSKVRGNCSNCKFFKRQHLIHLFWCSLLTYLTTSIGF